MQAVDVARESGATSNANVGTGGGRGGGGDMNGINLDNVNLDELPAYEERGSTVRIDPANQPQTMGNPQAHSSMGQAMGLAAQSGAASSTATSSPHAEVFTPPAEPPPGYEEVQRGSVADELERRLRSGELEADEAR